MLESQAYSCLYCGEPAEALLDLSADNQQYYRDCLVCYRPILFGLRTDGQDQSLNVCREDD